MWPERLRTKEDLERLLLESTNYEERMPVGDAERAFDLSRMRALLATVGHPEVGPETFHVTGSKGKGSTARMVDACLRAAARGPVGLYVSPHLERIEERVCVDGVPVAGEELILLLELQAVHHPRIKESAHFRDVVLDVVPGKQRPPHAQPFRPVTWQIWSDNDRVAHSRFQ